MSAEVVPGFTPLGALAVVGVFAVGTLCFVLMRLVARRAEREAGRRMAEMERRHRGYLCRDMAWTARTEMRVREIRRRIGGRPPARGGSRDDGPGLRR